MDLRQEMAHIFDGYSWYQRNLGEVVVWHEYDSANSNYHPTYDEGGRHYTSGVAVPALWVIITEDRSNRSNEGRKPTEKISMAVSARAMDLSGVSDPEDYTRHLNDVVRYDGRLWTVTEYNIRGRVPDAVVLGISGTQIYSDEEMSFDNLPPGMDLAGSHRRLPYPNNEVVDYPFHDGPGVFDASYTSVDGVLDGSEGSALELDGGYQ